MRGRDKETALGAMRWLAILAAALVLAALMLASCAKTVYVPVEASRSYSDTLRITEVRADSVCLRDSVAVVQKGDTVFHTVWRDRYRYRLRTDTVHESVTDTVRTSVPYPVERKLTKWERAKMDIGGYAIAAVAIAALSAAAWMARKLKKKTG